MSWQAAFFDLDGTLMDTSRGIIHTTDYVIEKFHLAALTEDEQRSFIGPPIQDSFQRHYGLSQDQAKELAAAWRNIYKDKFLLEAMPYEGIYDVLRLCREHGIKTGVATNKREDYARELLEHFHFTPLLDCIAGTDFEGRLTKSDLIRICMDQTGVTDGAQCIMVGDTEGDWEAAQKAGVRFLGVTYGFGFAMKDDRPKVKVLTLANDCRQLGNRLTS